MADFELPTPAANYQTPIGIIRYAEEVQSHLERHDDYVGRETLHNLSLAMNNTTPFLNETAILAGIYKKYGPAESGDITEAEVSLEKGILGGASYGFMVLPIEDFEPDPFNSKDPVEEKSLYEQIRAKAVGDYVVCHMLHHNATVTSSQDYGVMNIQQFQAIGPIMSADLHLLGAYEQQVEQQAYDESLTVMNGLQRRSRRDWERVLEVLNVDQDPLEALILVSPELRRIASYNNSAVLNALNKVLGRATGQAGISKPYVFREFPPVVQQNSTGEFEIVSMPADGFPVYVESLSINPGYYYNDQKDELLEKPKPGREIFVDMAKVSHTTYIERFHVPLSLIKPGSFVRLEKLTA